MIDSHCHLEMCDDPVDVLVERATAAGVERMLAIGMTNETCAGAIEAARTHESVFVSAGHHPHESEGWGDADLDSLRQLASDPSVRAIGETGLDYKRDYAPRDDQRNAFVAQIGLARELGKPLVIHTRFAADDTIALLDELGQGIATIIHCFSLTDHVDDCIERGWYCSFAGNVTYPKARDLQQAAKQIPDELLLVETDAPYLTAQRWRGKPNEPAKVTATAEFLAELRGTGYGRLEAIVAENSARLFDW